MNNKDLEVMVNAPVVTEVQEGILNYDLDLIGQVTETVNSVCSIKPQNEDEEVDLYNAINDVTCPIKEMVNNPIEMVGVYLEEVVITSEESGMKSKELRVVIIDKDNNSYSAMSKGVMMSLQKIFALKGSPFVTPWEKPVVIVPKIKTVGKNNVTTLALAKSK